MHACVRGTRVAPLTDCRDGTAVARQQASPCKPSYLPTSPSCLQDKDMVDRLLALKAGLEAMLAASFAGCQPYAASLRDALSYALNTRCAAGGGGSG